MSVGGLAYQFTLKISQKIQQEKDRMDVETVIRAAQIIVVLTFIIGLYFVFKSSQRHKSELNKQLDEVATALGLERWELWTQGSLWTNRIFNSTLGSR